MHKTVIRILSVLIIPIMLLGCQEEGAEGVDKDVLGEVLAQSIGTSNELDSMLLKAYGIASLGHDMAASDPDGAMVKFEDALALARQARAAKYRSLYNELSTKTADWPKADKDQVSGAIKNIDEASRRVWLIRYIAEGMAKVDPARADEVAGFAVNELRKQAPSESYRDMEIRHLAAYYSESDISKAAAVAGNIADPRIKTYAFKELGKKALEEGNKAAANNLLNAASSYASTIPDQIDDVPVTGTYAPSAPEAVKSHIQELENAKQVAYMARKIAEIALVKNEIDTRAAAADLDAAVNFAMSIDKDKFPETRAYALSDIAARYAVIDTNKAEAIMAEVPSECAAARISGTVQIAKVKEEVSAANIISDINPLLSQAEEVEEPYEGAAALYAVGKMIAETSPEKAKELAGKIEYPNMMNDLLIESALVWAAENIEEAKLVIEELAPAAAAHGGGHGVYFNVYKYAPAMNLYQKAAAYKGMADVVKDTDADTAMKLYTKAAGYAAESGSGQMQWNIAAEMCKLDHTKFMSVAAKLQPADPKSQTMALMNIANDWSASDDPYAGIVWDEALKVAASPMNDFEAGCLLGKVGAACSGYFPEKSADAFNKASVRYAKIGAE